MNEMLELIKNRRTIRKYKSEQIAEAELNAILEAGLHAPSAGGRQSAIIVVSQDAFLNEELGRLNQSIETIVPKMGNVSLEQPSIADDSKIKSAFYGAPTVLTIFAPFNHYNMTGDCFMAAQNIITMAQQFGIGSCVVGRASQTFATKRGQEIQKLWRIDEGLEAKISVILGYPDGNYPQYNPRKTGRIIRV